MYKMISVLIFSALLSGCATGMAQPGGFSVQAQKLKEHQAEYKFDFKHTKIKSFKLPEKQVVTGVNRESMAKIDSERRDLRKIAEKLKKAVSQKDATIEDLVRVIKLLEIERDINSELAQKALRALDSAETKSTINDYFAKGVSVVAILALIL